MRMILKSTLLQGDRAIWIIASSLAAVAAQPAAAQQGTPDPGFDVVDTAKVIAAQTCAGIDKVPLDPLQPDLKFDGSWWRVVPSNRFAYFAASHSGEMVDPGGALNLVRSVDRPRAEGHDGLRKLIGHIQT